MRSRIQTGWSSQVESGNKKKRGKRKQAANDAKLFFSRKKSQKPGLFPLSAFSISAFH
jgi:hypothetical protein